MLRSYAVRHHGLEEFHFNFTDGQIEIMRKFVSRLKRLEETRVLKEKLYKLPAFSFGSQVDEMDEEAWLHFNAHLRPFFLKKDVTYVADVANFVFQHPTQKSKGHVRVTRFIDGVRRSVLDRFNNSGGFGFGTQSGGTQTMESLWWNYIHYDLFHEKKKPKPGSVYRDYNGDSSWYRMLMPIAHIKYMCVRRMGDFISDILANIESGGVSADFNFLCYHPFFDDHESVKRRKCAVSMGVCEILVSDDKVSYVNAGTGDFKFYRTMIDRETYRYRAGFHEPSGTDSEVVRGTAVVSSLKWNVGFSPGSILKFSALNSKWEASGSVSGARMWRGNLVMLTGLDAQLMSLSD